MKLNRIFPDDHPLYELVSNAEKASRWYGVNLLKGNFSKYKTILMDGDDKTTASLTLNIQDNEIELNG